jgi:uncharacterized protein (DUF433 family)
MQRKLKRKEIAHPHIERRKGMCGGEPVIKGTRLSVSLIVELERLGKTVDEIVGLYPHINHAQVYDALAYYYDNKEEIDAYIEEGSESAIRRRYAGEPWLK